MVLHNRSHRCLVWLQKSCLSGIIWCCAEEGAQYLLSTRQCHSAVTMLHRLLHSELAHFLRSSCIHAAFWAAFGPYLSNTECVNNPGRTQNLLNPAEVFPLPGYSLFPIALSIEILAYGGGRKEGWFLAWEWGPQGLQVVSHDLGQCHTP